MTFRGYFHQDFKNSINLQELAQLVWLRRATEGGDLDIEEFEDKCTLLVHFDFPSLLKPVSDIDGEIQSLISNREFVSTFFEDYDIEHKKNEALNYYKVKFEEFSKVDFEIDEMRLPRITDVNSPSWPIQYFATDVNLRSDSKGEVYFEEF